jgi:hypothetical protein
LETARLDRVLPLWFVVWSIARVQSLGWTGSHWDWSFIGRDFRIYRAAGEAVLNGGSPWAASAPWNGVDWHYAAPPTAAQLFAPLGLLPESLGLLVFATASLGLAWLGLRRVGLPVWWLLFPPLTEGLLAANPQIALFGLLVVSGPAVGSTPIARALAVGLKTYAIAPILARREWRAAVACLGLLGLSVAVGAGLWATYLADAGVITARLVDESQGGVSAAVILRPGVFGPLLPAGPVGIVVPWLVVGVVTGLIVLVAVRDVSAAGWLVAPLLLPAAEYHLATLAIPVARRRATWILAIPSVPTYLVGLLVLCWEIAADRPSLAANLDRGVSLREWLRDVPSRAAEPATVIDLGSGRAV